MEVRIWGRGVRLFGIGGVYRKLPTPAPVPLCPPEEPRRRMKGERGEKTKSGEERMSAAREQIKKDKKGAHLICCDRSSLKKKREGPN